MTALESPPPVAVIAPIRRLRVVGLMAMLVAGLLADFVAMFFATLLVVGVGGGSGLAFWGLLAATQSINVVLLTLGAVRVSRRLPSGRRPFVILAAVSAFSLSLAGGFDFSLIVLASEAPPYFEWARIGVPLAWLLAAVTWAGSCVLSESRRRAGRAYRWPVVVAGAVMAVLQVASWWWVPAAFERGLYSG
jgi:hypothetical protein